MGSKVAVKKGKLSKRVELLQNDGNEQMIRKQCITLLHNYKVPKLDFLSFLSLFENKLWTVYCIKLFGSLKVA